MGKEVEYSLGVKLGGLTYYCVASIVVQMVNKALFTVYQFDCPLLVGLLQMIVLIPVCYLTARPPLTVKLCRTVMPLAAVNVLNLASGLMGTAGLNVPMFIALRRFTLLATLLLERIIDRKRHDRMTYITIAVMLSGALLAALTDLTFNAQGYAAVFVNNFVTALFLVMIKKASAATGLTTNGLLFYKALLSVPLLAVLLYGSPELPRMAAYPDIQSRSFQAVLLGTAVLGITINHSTFVCTRVNDAMMTTVAGNLKNVVVTVLGAIAFPDFIFSPLNVFGLSLSMVGALWYAANSALKIRNKARAATALPSMRVLGGGGQEVGTSPQYQKLLSEEPEQMPDGPDNRSSDVLVAVQTSPQHVAAGTGTA